MLIKEIYEEYINFTPLSPRTKELYVNAYNNFWSEEIGYLELENLDYTVLQNGISTLLARYSYNTVKVYKNAIFKFIEIAELKNINFTFIGKNSICAGKPTKKKFFVPSTLEEFYNLIRHTRKSKSIYKKQYETVLWIGFFTGMRISEVLSLLKKDINLDKKEIYITKAKTICGIRTVYICNELHDILKLYLIDIKNDSDMLFVDKNNNQLKNTKISSYIRNYAKGRGYTIHFHSLREMFVKTMLDNNANIESVRVLLGHANVTTTLNIYLKISTEEIKKDLHAVYDKNNFRDKI